MKVIYITEHTITKLPTMPYRAQYRVNGRWIKFTVLGNDAYNAFDVARDVVGPNVGLAVFGNQGEPDRLIGGRV